MIVIVCWTIVLLKWLKYSEKYFKKLCFTRSQTLLARLIVKRSIRTEVIKKNSPTFVDAGLFV